MPSVVPKMAAIPDAPNRAAPTKARKQVKAYKRRQRKRRKNSGVRTHEKPQNPLIPKGAGCSAFLGAAARNAAQLELAEQEQRANNPYVPSAAYSAVSSASWANQSVELSQDLDSIAGHLGPQERAELEAQMAEIQQLSMHVDHRPHSPDEALLHEQFGSLAEHLTDEEKAELQAELAEVRQLSASVSQRQVRIATPDAEQLFDKYEHLAEHLGAESRRDLEAEIAVVKQLSQELSEQELPSGWGSQIQEQRSQTAPSPGSLSTGGATSQGARRSKRRTSSSLTRSQFGSKTDPDRPSSRDSMKNYLIKRPLASPNAVNNDLLRKKGKGSLGVGWEEFKKYERPASVTDLHSIERQLERRRKAELSALWADRTVPEWDGPCSVPPLALPERSLIGITRVAETVRDVFKGDTIQEEARTPRTAGWEPAKLSQYELAMKDGPARACTAKVGPGVPALNHRPVALGAYVDRFWAGPALAGLDKHVEVSTRREQARKEGRKSWSDKNRPPPVVVKKRESNSPKSPTDKDPKVELFRACTAYVSGVPADYAENEALQHIFAGVGRFLTGTCCADSVKEDLVHGSGAWGLVTFATPADVELAVEASKKQELKAGSKSIEVAEMSQTMVKRTPGGLKVWDDALQKASFEFDQLETKTLEFAGLLLEVVQATGLPSMDLCGLSDPYAVIKINNTKTPEEAVCDSYTSTVCKSTKEPEWHQDFTLPVPLDVVSDAELIIDLYDEDVGDDDDFMGRVRLNLSDMNAEWTDEWYELDVEDKEVYSKTLPDFKPNEGLTTTLPPLGLLRLRTRWVPDITDEDNGLKLAEQEELERMCLEMAQKGLEAKKQPIGKLTMHIVRAQGLPKMDIFGTCDPFVVLEHAGKKVKTPVVKQSQTPVWDSTFHFDVFDMNAEFHLVAYDWDRGHDDDDSGDHDEIGSANFSLGEILNKKRECEEWVPLFQSSALGILKTRGQVLCKLEFAPAFGGTDMFIEPGEGVIDVAKLELVVKRAQDVPQMDEVGSSDPYCVLSLHGVNSGAGKDMGEPWKSKDFRTRVVTHSLNPEWNQSFSFEVYDPTAVLHIDIFDEDFHGDDDYMCGLKIPVATLLNTNESHWYRMQDEDTLRDPEMAACVTVDKPQQRALSCPLGALLLQTDCQIHTKVETEATRADRLGDLHINIRQLNGLKLRKGRKPPSIFVEMEYDGDRKSTTIQKKTLTPVWNETFEYPVNKDPGLRSCVTCRIFLHDLLGNHELAGTVTISMKDATTRNSDFPIAFPFFVYDDSSKLHPAPRKLGELEISLVWKENHVKEDQELRPRASLRASAKHVVRATRSVLRESGVQSGHLSGADGFNDVIKDAIEHKDLLSNDRVVKSALRGTWSTAPNTALTKQASVLSQFGKMKGQQWVIIPTLELLRLQGVDNQSLGLSSDTQSSIWAEIEWNGEVVATTEEVVKSRGRPRLTQEDREKAESICYHCKQKGHWKIDCPQLNDNLKKRNTGAWNLGLFQPLPSTKTGASNALVIRIYARGTGVIGYSNDKQKGNKYINAVTRISTPKSPKSPAPSPGSPASQMSERDLQFIRAIEKTAEAEAAAAKIQRHTSAGNVALAAEAAAEAEAAQEAAALASESAAGLAQAEADAAEAAEAEAAAAAEEAAAAAEEELAQKQAEAEETMRASEELDEARAALDAERKGQGHETDSSAGIRTPDNPDNLAGVFSNESESRLDEIRDHLAFVEEISSPTSGPDVNEAVAKFHSAQNALREKNLEDALALYNDAIAYGHPNPAQCHNGAALCHSLLEDHDAAQERFALAVSADPHDDKIWHNNPSRASTPDRTAIVAAAPAPDQQAAGAAAAAEEGSSMLGMFDPSGLQMATTIGIKNSQQVASLGEEKEDRLREIFARADRNGDGALSRSELILRLRKDEELAELLQLPQRVGDDERDVFEAVFQGMDTDDDKSITSAEFVAYFSSYKSEFERAGTPDSRPSTAATSSEVLALTDGTDALAITDQPVVLPASPPSASEALSRPQTADSETSGEAKEKKKPSSSGSSRPNSRDRWRMIGKAVKEPIYAEKTVLAGAVTLFATGVRGFPREPLPLNVMPEPDVPEGVWVPRRYDGQLSIKVESQSVADYSRNLGAKKSLRGVAKGQAQALKTFHHAQQTQQKPKSQDCMIRIRVARALALTPVWQSDGDVDKPHDTCSPFVVVRERALALRTLRHDLGTATAIDDTHTRTYINTQRPHTSQTDSLNTPRLIADDAGLRVRVHLLRSFGREIRPETSAPS